VKRPIQSATCYSDTRTSLGTNASLGLPPKKSLSDLYILLLPPDIGQLLADRFVAGLPFLQEKIRISCKIILIYGPTRSLLDTEMMGGMRIFMDVAPRIL